MSEQFNFDIKLIFAILNGKVSAAINRKLYRNFRQYNVDITPEQWTVLLYLWEKDGVTQQELCNATFKDKPSMTRLIDNMERLNLVVRISGKTDRRINLIHRTGFGREIEIYRQQDPERGSARPQCGRIKHKPGSFKKSVFKHKRLKCSFPVFFSMKSFGV